MHDSHPDEWMTLDDEISEFLGGDPERQAKFDEAGRKIEVAGYVADIRRDLGLSPERFGEIIGCSPAEVLRLEGADFSEPAESMLDRILGKLGIRDQTYQHAPESALDSAGAITRSEL